MVTVDLRRGVDRQVITLRRCRNSRGSSSTANTSAGRHWVVPCTSSRPVPDTTPRPDAGRQPGQRTSPRRTTTNARTARSARRVACPWPTHPSRVDPQASGLGVLDDAWFNRGCSGSASSTTADRLSGITVEDAAEELPRRLAPVDHVLGGLPERQPHQAVPRIAGGEDQRLHHTAPTGLGSTRKPIRPKSTCNSSPGSPSAMRTVGPRPRLRPHSSST